MVNDKEQVLINTGAGLVH